MFEKKLWSDKGHGEIIRVITCRNDDDESERVAKEIVTHKLRFGNEWEQYAVLYRSNFQARMLEAQLRQLQVPYKLSGGQSFFARSEIKDIMGYLRLILNPEDDSAFLRIINTPKRGVGPATIQQLYQLARARGIPLTEATWLLVDTDELKPKMRTTLRVVFPAAVSGITASILAPASSSRIVRALP